MSRLTAGYGKELSDQDVLAWLLDADDGDVIAVLSCFVKVRPAFQLAMYKAFYGSSLEPTPQPPVSTDCSQFLCPRLFNGSSERDSLLSSVPSGPDVTKPSAREIRSSINRSSLSESSIKFDRLGSVEISHALKRDRTTISFHEEEEEDADESATFRRRPTKMSTLASGGASAMVPVGSLASTSSISSKPVVQFSAFIYFCCESENSIAIDVLRIGDLTERSAVICQTVDGSAKAGKDYEAMRETLEFSPGEYEKRVNVSLIDDDSWEGRNLEFNMELVRQGAENAFFGTYQRHARVKIFDDDCFPSNLHAHLIRSGHVEQIDPVSLFLDYARWNWRDKVVRHRSLWQLIIGLFHNLTSFGALFLNVYVVDYILKTDHSEESLIFVKHRELSLLLLVLLSLIVLGCTHVLDHAIWAYLPIGGPARKMLQVALLDKFLNCKETSASLLGDGSMIRIMTTDVAAVVQGGYQKLIVAANSFGSLIFMVLYQFIGPYVFEMHFNRVSIGLMLCFPVFGVCFLFARRQTTMRYLRNQAQLLADLDDQIIGTVTHYRLIASFNQRTSVVGKFETIVQQVNAAVVSAAIVLNNDEYVAKWLTVFFYSLWAVIGGLQVIRGQLSLGLFMTALKTFLHMGKAWESIFDVIWDIHRIFPELERIVRLLNWPTDLPARVRISHFRRDVSSSILKNSDGCSRDSFNVADDMPIEIRNMSLLLGSAQRHAAFTAGAFKIQQGQLVCLTGQAGAGKGILLKMLGGEILPDTDVLNVAANETEAWFFLPSHLRNLYVSTPIFFHGSLYDNLIFGLWKHTAEARPARIRSICCDLGIRDLWDMYGAIDDSDEGDIFQYDWTALFSQSECQRLSIARALVYNPEVLCLHKPCLGLADDEAVPVMHAFRDFVTNKGVDMNLGSIDKRRPRTCIFSTERRGLAPFADEVFRISRACGVQRLDRNQGEWPDRCATYDLARDSSAALTSDGR